MHDKFELLKFAMSSTVIQGPRLTQLSSSQYKRYKVMYCFRILSITLFTAIYTASNDNLVKIFSFCSKSCSCISECFFLLPLCKSLHTPSRTNFTRARQTCTLHSHISFVNLTVLSGKVRTRLRFL